MKRTLFLLITILFSNIIYGQYKVKFEVKQPAGVSGSDKTFIARNFNNWDPSLKENSFIVDKSGSGIYEMQLPAGNYEYKFTRGAWIKLK